MATPSAVRHLVTVYERNREEYLAPSFNEAQLRQQFLDPFFEELGWDVANRQGFSEQYKEVVHEDSIPVAGRKKAPDYCFRIGRERRFFVEAKKPSINLPTDSGAAYQLRRYAWSAKLPYSLLTNFRVFAVYDTRVRPRQTDASSRARLPLLHIERIDEWWDEFHARFSKLAIQQGSFERLQAERNRTGSTTVDNQFLTEIERWRLDLARDLHGNNPRLAADQINLLAQLTIDRILFLRICEDRKIEPLGQLRDRTKRARGKYAQLLRVFEEAQRRYNSALFHIQAEGAGDSNYDRLSTTIRIGDQVLDQIIGSLYFPECPYEFSVLPADVLGHVYEKFLGSQVVLRQPSGIRIEPKPEVRKAGGVYYTPTHIVRSIVRRTLDSVLPSPSSPTRPLIKAIDMACGSGSFLIEVYEHLLQWYLEWHKQRRGRGALAKVPRIGTPGYDERLTLQERKRILVDHVFGVDIDPQAVEVARLSLLLKVVEDPAIVPRQMEFGEMRRRLLPDLSGNVVCGNSIVSNDVFSIGGLTLTSEEQEKVNAFDWASPPKFEAIKQTGGFTVIVGNPPYSYRNATLDKLKPYYRVAYEACEGNYDTYKFFLEQACRLLAPNGAIGQIVNASFLIQPQFEKLRRLLDRDLRLTGIDVMGSNVFAGVTIDTAILIGRRRSTGAGSGRRRSSRAESVVVREPTEPETLERSPSWSINQRRLERTSGHVIDWRLEDPGYALVEKLVQAFPKLESLCDLSVGINTGSMRTRMIADTCVGPDYHPCIKGTGLKRYGPVTTDGWIRYSPEQIRAAGPAGRSLPPETFFTLPKILVVRTRNVSLPVRIIATIDSKQGYNLNRLSNVVSRDGTDLRTILGILNSRLMNWLFQTRFFNYEIKPVYLKAVPIPTGSDAQINRLVDERMEAGLRIWRTAITVVERERLARKIDSLEAQIEQHVERLYGLTDAEKTLVGRLPNHTWAQGTDEFADDNGEAADGDEHDD
jgi:hypothetical protein